MHTLRHSHLFSEHIAIDFRCVWHTGGIDEVVGLDILGAGPPLLSEGLLLFKKATIVIFAHTQSNIPLQGPREERDASS
jgi:hypothetical protein